MDAVSLRMMLLAGAEAEVEAGAVVEVLGFSMMRVTNSSSRMLGLVTTKIIKQIKHWFFRGFWNALIILRQTIRFLVGEQMSGDLLSRVLIFLWKKTQWLELSRKISQR